jgi:syntaxin 5
VPDQDTYIQSRSTAIESIESTIAELGQIFTQLANMVAEQRETVQRIDADTMDIASNVSGAQRELLKYYASISSNRWLMLKVFGVLIVFVSHHHLSFGISARLMMFPVSGFYPRFGVNYSWQGRRLKLL